MEAKFPGDFLNFGVRKLILVTKFSQFPNYLVRLNAWLRMGFPCFGLKVKSQTTNPTAPVISISQLKILKHKFPV